MALETVTSGLSNMALTGEMDFTGDLLHTPNTCLGSSHNIYALRDSSPLVCDDYMHSRII